VNALLVNLQSKNTNNAKSEVTSDPSSLICGVFTIDSSMPTLRRNLNKHPIFLQVSEKDIFAKLSSSVHFLSYIFMTVVLSERFFFFLISRSLICHLTCLQSYLVCNNKKRKNAAK
jgi:L-asparagine transporter-like permease